MGDVENSETIRRLGILIADSNLYTRTLLRSMLAQLGVRLIQDVSDGAAALTAMQHFSLNIMIMDWDLPILSGRELLRVARPSFPVIVISNSGLSKHVHEAIKLGAEQFLVRPISPKLLEQRLVAVATKSRKIAQGDKHSIQGPGGDAVRGDVIRL
jgi:two-component system chemotaxis response regulator CheY